MKITFLTLFLVSFSLLNAQNNVLSINKLDSVYKQDFDVLGAFESSTSVLKGWSVFVNGEEQTTLRPSNGSILQTGAFNFGDATANDRALGLRATSTAQGELVLILQNNTGADISKFALYYTGEQWYGGLSEEQSLDLEIGFGKSFNEIKYQNSNPDFENPQDCNSLKVSRLTVCISPKGQLNGNSSENRMFYNTQFDMGKDLIKNGEYISFKWTDDNNKTLLASHALALDEVGFVAFNDSADTWYTIGENLLDKNNWTRFPDETPSSVKPKDKKDGFDDKDANFVITKNVTYTGDFKLKKGETKLIVNPGISLTLGSLEKSKTEVDLVLLKNATFISQLYEAKGDVKLDIEKCSEGSNVIFDSNSPNVGKFKIPEANYFNLEIRDSHGGAAKEFSMKDQSIVRNKFVYSASSNVFKNEKEALNIELTADSIPFEIPNYTGEFAFQQIKVANGSRLHFNKLKNTPIDANVLRLNADFTLGQASSLNLLANQSLIINSGSFKHDGILVLDNDASLIINDGVKVSGSGVTSINRQQKISGVNITNHWSSPTNNATIGLGGTISGNRHWVYRNGEDDNTDYVVLKQPTPIGKGRGYTAKGARPVTFIANDISELNIGSFTYDAAAEHDGDKDDDEYYLLGNPYSSGFSIPEFLKVNAEKNKEILGSVYLFSQINEFGQYSRVADNIAINLLGSTDPGLIIPDSIQEAMPFTDFSIASGQGFFVIDKTPDDDRISIEYSPKMQVGLNNNFKSAEPNTVLSRFWLLINDGTNYKTTLVGFATDATNAADDKYDAPIAVTEKTLNIWSYINNKMYEIQGLAPATVASIRVPLGININKAGQHEISAVKASNAMQITLLDAQTGEFIDLRQGSHKFIANATGVINDRFFLFVRGSGQPVGINDEEVQEVLNTCDNFSTKKQLLTHLKNAEVKELNIYNTVGQSIYKTTAFNGDNNLNNFTNTGVHIVKILKTDGNVCVGKIEFK